MATHNHITYHTRAVQMRSIRPFAPSLVLSYFALLVLLCRNEGGQGGLLVKAALAADDKELSCSIIATGDDNEYHHVHVRDPALQEMEYDVGDGPQTTLVYVEPDINTFYKLEDEKGQVVLENENPPIMSIRTKMKPKYNGFHGKFINLSNQPLTLYWEDNRRSSKSSSSSTSSSGGTGAALHNMRTHPPFTATGTATLPGHSFVFTPVNNPNEIVHRFIVGQYPDNLHVYDPYKIDNDANNATAKNLEAALNEQERKKYDHWMRTLRFHEYYFNKTGRSYLASYLRDAPKHWMWPADYFGQEHWVSTRETHFVQHPPPELAYYRPIQARGRQRILQKDQARLLSEFRSNNDDSSSNNNNNNVLNMTLTVISCVPRVFEILNFLSPVEVEHILELAQGVTLEASKTGDDKQVVNDSTTRTRTSKNSWLSRERSPIIDAIYRRAADLQRMDEALMRDRHEGEQRSASSLVVRGLKPLTERLQLVHYDVGEVLNNHRCIYVHIPKPSLLDRQSTVFTNALFVSFFFIMVLLLLTVVSRPVCCLSYYYYSFSLS